ncbi:MAG: hypothetical protein QF689_06965, partial [Candidatus Latescibacteria bacterium]|nr:hypothetical protein [Candidatus Latescibacterota bacterium]
SLKSGANRSGHDDKKEGRRQPGPRRRDDALSTTVPPGTFASVEFRLPSSHFLRLRQDDVLP